MERITTVLKRLNKRGPAHREGFVQLFISKRLIQGLAAAMLTLFVPIFIYESFGQSLGALCLFYFSISFGYSVFLVPAMKFTNKIGFSRALAFSAILSVLQYGVMYFMTVENIWLLIAPLALTIIGFRLFHWVPYHVDFAEFTKGSSRGRDVSLMLATIAFMGVIGPILAGFIISNSGYNTLFLISVILMFVAAISYLFVPDTHEKFTWSYLETYKNLFSQKFKPLLFSEFAGGLESSVALIAWPIFLFVVLDGNILEVGALSTVIVGVTIGVQLMVGRYLDKAKQNNVKTLKAGSVLYALGWIGKIFVLSAAQIFFIGLYHSITKIFTKTPYNALFYDMTGDQGRYIDEFTVMKEMTHHFGRSAGLLCMLGLTLFFSVEWTFIIGAVASLFLNMIYMAAND
jgi:YQGE family putative transporter